MTNIKPVVRVLAAAVLGCLLLTAADCAPQPVCGEGDTTGACNYEE